MAHVIECSRQINSIYAFHAETIFCHVNHLSEHGLKIHTSYKMTAVVNEAVIQFTESKIELYEIIEVLISERLPFNIFKALSLEKLIFRKVLNRKLL